MEAIKKDRDMTRGELAVEHRIALCADVLKNALVAHGERNAKVLAAALLTIVEHNPELGVAFEDLCGNWIVKQVVHNLNRPEIAKGFEVVE